MASIPLVNGGSQPVFAIDTLNGPQLSANAVYAPAGTPTMLMGPKLDFFAIGNIGNIAGTQAGVNGALQVLLHTVQQTSTVAFYQPGAAQVSLAVYPTGAYTASTLASTVTGLGTVNGFNFAVANVTNVGFDLSQTAT